VARGRGRNAREEFPQVEPFRSQPLVVEHPVPGTYTGLERRHLFDMASLNTGPVHRNLTRLDSLQIPSGVACQPVEVTLRAGTDTVSLCSLRLNGNRQIAYFLFLLVLIASGRVSF
jgi:hypothetical protein